MHSVEKPRPQPCSSGSSACASESRSIREAHGRILAEIDLSRRARLPGFDNSAMDGYAVRGAELPGVFPVVATVGAGQVIADRGPGARRAVRIFTGAPMPAGLDTVVIQEDAEAEGDRRHAARAPSSARTSARSARTSPTGDVAVRRGHAARRRRARPAAPRSALAEVPVARPPRVAIIATGDELVDVDDAAGPEPDRRLVRAHAAAR